VTLRKRLDRLEGKRGAAALGPCVIFLCEAETGEPLTAILLGGGTLTRKDEETADAFTARASAGQSKVAYLPENGRDALATGKAPEWSKGELVLQHLRDKHANTHQ
jgi:hypothetical protein